MKIKPLFLFATATALSTVLLPATPCSGQIPIRRANPVVQGPVSVESTVIKSGDIPGIFYGTNKGFRYFFEVKNNVLKRLAVASKSLC